MTNLENYPKHSQQVQKWKSGPTQSLGSPIQCDVITIFDEDTYNRSFYMFGCFLILKHIE